MKKLILFAVLIIVLASCKKSGSGSPVNTITATINDTFYTFNNHILDTTFVDDSTIEISLNAQDFELNTFAISFGEKNKPILAGTTYGSFGDSVHLLLAAFAPFNTPTHAYEAIPYPHISSNSQLTVTLTSINSITIQGTFKGNIFLNGDTTQVPKKVTNGTFNFTKALTVQ